MVSNKRPHYGGFDGFRSPVVPKAPRSIRRNSHKKPSAGSEICAFELLAAVAGKLLQESEGSASSTSSEQKEQINIPKDNVKQEPLEIKLKPARLEDLDQGCCAESQFVPELSNLELKLEPPLKDSLHSDNDSGLEHASIVTTSDLFTEIGTNVKLEVSDSKNIVIDTPSKSEGGSYSHGDLCDATANIPKLIEKETEKLQDTVELNKSYCSVHVPFYSDPVPSACFQRHRDNNVKVGIRDDDENCFSYNQQHITKMKAFRLQSRGGYRRIRKMLTSKYWKTAPKLKDYELSNTNSGGGGLKCFNQYKKYMYKRERCQSQTESPFKKRKLFPGYVEETSSESISNLPERHLSKRVKFSIKSFIVPELYLEMPETSTVGSLKRNVMEALTAILGGELHLGVLVEGKKVRDENRTLEETGISLNSETLGFMLEPSLPEASQKQPPMSPPPQSDNHQPSSTSPDSPITETVSLSNSSESKLEKEIEKNKEEEIEIVVDAKAKAKAIIPITAMTPEALSIVPLNHNNGNNKVISKKCEASQSQRRTRRPFSVYEVEALVEAVETLGTGRWRDVKIRAFDDANHRTYVDLKDKWKTLVHTASISPQQRRGEPVPQDLLDRVLAAHAYWSQHQSKQNGNANGNHQS